MQRRRFTHAFKQQLVEATLQPDASIASVALEHRINANQLHRWRQELLRNHQVTPSPATLIPVCVAPEAANAPTMVQPRHHDNNGTLTIEFAQARLSVSGSIDPVLLEAAIRLLR
jgi:transposase